MKLFCHVLSLTVPLIIAALLLLFAIFSEWWSYDDHARARKSFPHDANNKHFFKGPLRHKITKLDGLFGSCYAYKYIDVIQPLKMTSLNNTADTCDAKKCDSSLCMCCKSKPDCCFSTEKRCNFIPDCDDQSDEQLDECFSKIEQNYYDTQWYDEFNSCYRIKYNYLRVFSDIFKPSEPSVAQSSVEQKKFRRQSDPNNYDEPNDEILAEYVYDSSDQNITTPLTEAQQVQEPESSIEYNQNGNLGLPATMPVTNIVETLTPQTTLTTIVDTTVTSTVAATTTPRIVATEKINSSVNVLNDEVVDLNPKVDTGKIDDDEKSSDYINNLVVEDQTHISDNRNQDGIVPNDTQVTVQTTETKTTGKKKIKNSNDFQLKIMKINLFILLNLLICLLITIFCLISIVFVKCCNYKNDSTTSAKYEYYDNVHNYKYMFRNRKRTSEDDYEEDNEVDLTSKLSCCKCTYILCPFIFYSVFTFGAFLSSLIAILAHLYKLYSMKTYALGFDLYQLNTWLFECFRFGLSFYLLLACCFLYFLTFVISTCVTCQIRSSPQWRSRYSDVYEVMQMNDVNTVPKPKHKTEVKLKSKKVVRA
jgi:hypothetical protein